MGKNSRDKLFEVADRQQGFFTSQQAENCGFHRSHFHRLLDSGEWIRENRGIYRLSRYPISDRPDLIEWALWSRNKKGDIQGVWSHETALDLYSLCDIMPTKLHMTVPKNFRRSMHPPSVLKLYFSDLQKTDWVEQQGYCVTTPIRTLLDLAETRQISDEFLKQAVLEGHRKGIVLQQQIDALPSSKAALLLK
jgi:predicted transcriptional regulator of viral defense system